MKKVKCIDSKNCTYLTLGKEYNVIKASGNTIRIINDMGDEWNYEKFRFEDMKEDSTLMPAITAGNIIELKDGTRGLVIKTPNHRQYVYWFDKSGRMTSTSSSINKKGSELPARVDIVKIYEGITNERPFAAMSNHIYSLQKTLWEKKKTLEVTLKEVADKFGVTEEELIITDYE